MDEKAHPVWGTVSTALGAQQEGEAGDGTREVAGGEVDKARLWELRQEVCGLYPQSHGEP